MSTIEQARKLAKKYALDKSAVAEIMAITVSPWRKRVALLEAVVVAGDKMRPRCICLGMLRVVCVVCDYDKARADLDVKTGEGI